MTDHPDEQRQAFLQHAQAKNEAQPVLAPRGWGAGDTRGNSGRASRIDTIRQSRSDIDSIAADRKRGRP